MNLFIAIILSYILSYGMEIAHEAGFIKDAMNLGYKINFDRNSEIADKSKSSTLQFLIPFYNLYVVFKNKIKYEFSTNFNQLVALRALEKMSDEEIKEFQKSPTSLNALLLSFKFEFRVSLSESINVLYRDGNIAGKIYYKEGRSSDEIEVLRATKDLFYARDDYLKNLITYALDGEIMIDADEPGLRSEEHEQTIEVTFQDEINHGNVSNTPESQDLGNDSNTPESKGPKNGPKLTRKKRLSKRRP